MEEIKIRELKKRQFAPADEQDFETIQAFEKETQVEVYFERDEENDEPIFNPDGSVSYIARCVNINGVQWQIPAEVKTMIPKSVYEVLKQSEDLKEQLKPKPVNLYRVDLSHIKRS